MIAINEEVEAKLRELHAKEEKIIRSDRRPEEKHALLKPLWEQRSVLIDQLYIKDRIKRGGM